MIYRAMRRAARSNRARSRTTTKSTSKSQTTKSTSKDVSPPAAQAIGAIIVAALILAVTTQSTLAFVLTVLIGTMLYAMGVALKSGQHPAMLLMGTLGVLLVVGVGIYAVVHDHNAKPVTPQPRATMSLAQAEPWRNIKPLTATSPTNPTPEVTITGCTVLHGVPVATPRTATKTAPSQTAATISGSVTNIDKTTQDFMITLSITAGSFNEGGANVQVTNVAPGQTVLWNTKGNITNHPTATPTCEVSAAQSETAQ